MFKQIKKFVRCYYIYRILRNERALNVATIIHDRDGRLRDARYSSLTDLCTAIDDHNDYVKYTLFRSWFRCDSLSCNTHLTMIKNLVNFNHRMKAQLGFDFACALTEKKGYYDTQHHNIREVVCPKTGEKSALKFANLTEVRAKFSDEQIDKLMGMKPNMLLIDCLSKHFNLTQRISLLFMKSV